MTDDPDRGPVTSYRIHVRTLEEIEDERAMLVRDGCKVDGRPPRTYEAAIRAMVYDRRKRRGEPIHRRGHRKQERPTPDQPEEIVIDYGEPEDGEQE